MILFHLHENRNQNNYRKKEYFFYFVNFEALFDDPEQIDQSMDV